MNSSKNNNNNTSMTNLLLNIQLFTKENFKFDDIDDIILSSYLKAIDNESIKQVKSLYKENSKNNIKKDIVFKLYNYNQLNYKRFKFIIKKCTDYLHISSCLIKALLKNNNKELLELLFKKFKFFDNDFIINLLIWYKNQIQISDADLYPTINSEKYKISVELNDNYDVFNSSYYLFNVCKSGIEHLVKFLVKHGANINIENIKGKTPLIYACRSGNINIVKYLVEHGADVNKKKL